MKRADRIFLGVIMVIAGAIVFDIHLPMTGGALAISGAGLLIISYLDKA